MQLSNGIQTTDFTPQFQRPLKLSSIYIQENWGNAVLPGLLLSLRVFSFFPPDNLAFTFLSFTVQDLPIYLWESPSSAPDEAITILTTVHSARSRRCEHGCRKREHCLVLPIRSCPLASLLSLFHHAHLQHFHLFSVTFLLPVPSSTANWWSTAWPLGIQRWRKEGRGGDFTSRLLGALSWSFWEPLSENRESHREERRGYFWIRGELPRPGRRVFIEPTLRAEMLASPELSLG